ncbi:MAG: HD family phosphohydrolase [Christensenellales bacterium]|jgi:putative nucleotidyltransferase with HDIG domain
MKLNQKTTAEPVNKSIKKKPLRKPDRNKMLFAGSIFLVFAVSVSCVLLSIARPQISVRIGDVLNSDVLAPRDMVDEEATVASRLQASSSVEKVYKLDEEIYASLTNGVIAFMDGLDRIRADCELLRLQKASAAEAGSALASMGSGNLTAAQWASIITPEEISALKPVALDALSDDDIYGLLSLPETDFMAWTREAQLRINAVLRRGIKDSTLQETRTGFRQGLEPLTPLAIKNLCGIMAREFINPTLIYSETDTLIAMDEAARAVEDQYIKKGSVLVPAGTVVTDKVYQLLVSAGAVRVTGDRVFMNVLIAVCIGIFLTCIVALIAVYLPRYLSSSSKALLSSLLIGAALIIALISFRFNPVFNPIYFAAFMLTMLVSGRVAAVSVLYLSLIFGLMCLGPAYDYGIFARSLVMTLVGGFAGVLSVRKAARRSAVFAGALFSTFVMSIALWVFSLIDSTAGSALLFDILRILGTNVLCAIVGIGIMPFWEWLFRLATPQRLAELSNADQPLLRRLMMEAPGTYHHSMLTATLAEAAATAIGADALLARVGAFYHDVGKLKRPIYFKENQRPGDNPHDALEPEKSAAVLTAHVKDGVLMLQKAKMPWEIISIAQEHHGNSLASFFYYNAVKQNGNQNLSDAPFRYAGPNPQTKESAIVSICDACEAAVRSLDNPSEEQIREMVNKIIRTKIEDGQFDRAPVTLADLGRIESSIMATFKGILHERIEYPELEDIKSDHEEILEENHD